MTSKLTRLTDEELEELAFYAGESTCHPDPNYQLGFESLATGYSVLSIVRELQERRKAERDSEPVADVVVWSSPNEERTCDIRWRRHDVEPGPLYRHARPAPALVGEPVAKKVACWSCKNEVEISAIGDCDGYCPICNSPIDLDEEPYTVPQLAPDRDQVRREHADWSQATFGNVGPVGPLKHLSKEALEAAAEPGDLSEWADMQFLLWDAQRRAGITDKQITQAMIEKLAVNKQREWPEPKDGEPRLHIKEQPAPVVPEDVLEALQKVARIRLDMNDFDGDRRGIADCLGDAEEALIEVVNRRAAMLQTGDTVSGNSFSDLDLEGMSHGNNPQANAYRELLAYRRSSPVIGIDPASGPDRTVEVRYVAPPGYVMVPRVPSQAHLNSIAMRYRHDFYLLNDAQKDSALATSRQMYEECSGQGFYTLPDAPQEVKGCPD